MYLRSSSLEKDSKGLKGRETFAAELLKLQYNITLIFDIDISNRMFSSAHHFISGTLFLNLWHCYLKCKRL